MPRVQTGASSSPTNAKRRSSSPKSGTAGGAGLMKNSLQLALVQQSSPLTPGVDPGSCAEFTDKKFFCDAGEQMGFVFRDNLITKTVENRWAERVGLRVGDEIVLIQTDFPEDQVVETFTRGAGGGNEEKIAFTPFAPLSQRDKIIRLKRKNGVGFVIARRVQGADVEAASRTMQAVLRGKKDRDLVARKRAGFCGPVCGFFQSCCTVWRGEGPELPSIDCLTEYDNDRRFSNDGPPPPLLDYYPPAPGDGGTGFGSGTPLHTNNGHQDQEDIEAAAWREGRMV
mmetsp:Transcript_13092/g.32001  ORF Transcript_13092/g.32001 Transcript_13092/m.32001 type:complete len:284 (-) Transcript_13092:383-1234(-)|eukprot:CAMPEP_0178990036 /NCGR_PEP_ID=MMETSP0795-20121207/4706_1 /TAXON_ID=88552 /ORGANISM="Amoebophrya sp., Strain Ameob2" /LENGTH=283 /DNA_ID=CAMNT_0020681503 /DNA_START=286 /DNA_END=1140 /DNA_ORIENTATION=-